MYATTITGSAIWLSAYEVEADMVLFAGKLCDPCLSALEVSRQVLYKSMLPYLVLLL